jgi:hypothetical protein
MSSTRVSRSVISIKTNHQLLQLSKANAEQPFTPDWSRQTYPDLQLWLSEDVRIDIT